MVGWDVVTGVLPPVLVFRVEKYIHPEGTLLSKDQSQREVQLTRSDRVTARARKQKAEAESGSRKRRGASTAH